MTKVNQIKSNQSHFLCFSESIEILKCDGNANGCNIRSKTGKKVPWFGAFGFGNWVYLVVYIVYMEGYGAQAWVLSRPFCMDLMCLFDHEPSFWLDDDMYDSLLA